MAAKNNVKNRYPLPITSGPGSVATAGPHVTVRVESATAPTLSSLAARKATDLYCPASKSTKHTWDTSREREVGRSWHGAVVVVPCKDCGYEYCNH